MNDDIIDFAENIVGVKLNDWQKEILLKLQNAKDKDKELFMYAGRKTGMSFIKSILFNFNLLQKVKQMDNLQSQLNHQKAMWNELRLFLDEDKLFEYFTESFVDGYKNCLLSIKNKMQELEQGEKDEESIK